QPVEDRVIGSVRDLRPERRAHHRRAGGAAMEQVGDDRLPLRARRGPGDETLQTVSRNRVFLHEINPSPPASTARSLPARRRYGCPRRHSEEHPRDCQNGQIQGSWRRWTVLGDALTCAVATCALLTDSVWTPAAVTGRSPALLVSGCPLREAKPPLQA